MKLEKYKYRCSNNHVFEADHLAGEFIYGEFLLRSEKTDEEAYLNAINDKSFNELASMINNNISLKGKDELQRADILQEIFGICCDPAKDGSVFQIKIKPKCQICGTREVALVGPFNLPMFVEKKIPHVTHVKWNSLSVADKKELLENTN